MQKFLFRQAANLVQAFQPKLNILIYHRVMPEPDPLRPWEIDAQQFRKHLEWISGVFNVIPLADAVQQLKTGTLKRRSLVITFDDGYLDNATVALPLLKKAGLHATFFCTSAWLDGGLMWNDQVIEAIRRCPDKTISINELELKSIPVHTNQEKSKAIEIILPKLKYQEHNKRQAIANALTESVDGFPDLMMRREHIKLLYQEGMGIGGHSHSHPILSGIDDETLKEELEKNKQILEETLGTRLNLFSYPNGKSRTDFRAEQIRFIENAGYVASVTTELGSASADTNLFQLPRFTPWDNNSTKFLARLITLKKALG